MDLIYGALETDSWEKSEKRIAAPSAMEHIIITSQESSYIIEILQGKGNQLGFHVTGDMYGKYIHPHYVTDSISYSELIGRLKVITKVFKELDRSIEQDFVVKEKKRIER